MKLMMAYCGLECDSCPILKATSEKDKSLQSAMRELIADQCSKIYGINTQPKDITDCDGCRADTGRLFFGCLKCEIRKCANLKNIRNCAYCSEYACDLLKNHFSLDPGAQDRLEKIRKKLSI
jgi:hypothetical protein